MIRFEDKEDYFELDLLETVGTENLNSGDAYVSVKISSAGYTGQNDLWIDFGSMQLFCSSLIELEKIRRGEALLESISPGELKLKISTVDRAGHMVIEGKTGYQVQRENKAFYHSVEFGFEFEPSQLLKAAKNIWVKRIAEQTVEH